MPVIADTDEPPAKCCKYCEESTHGVDGPVSWRLTLDQDLIDTLKGSFPSWFQTASANANTTVTSRTTTATIATAATNNSNNSSNNNNTHCAASQPISVDTSNHHIISKSNHNNSKNSKNSNNHTLHHPHKDSSNISSSSSASPASSIASNSSAASVASSKKSSSSSSSTSSCCSSASSSASCASGKSAKSSVAAASTCCSSSSSSSSSSSLSLSPAASKHSTKISAKSQKAQKTKTTISKSSSLHSLGGSLLATFSSPGSATLEIISDSECNGFLSSHLSGKSFEHSFQDVILLHEAYDDMSEGEQRLNASLLSGSDDGTNSDCYDPRQSPPKAIVDSSPLQPAMDKNKESLKVKLMVRRPHSQLVEQGIIPPLKTSPAIHEQCKQLERAKTSDLLKAKIQQRPNREDLERRHILEEDECHIDPSLAEKQRMLKKARLADQLNSQIQHRPGPLELIKKNILHTEKPIEKIVKEGLVSFKATSEGLLTRPQHPHSYVTFEEDSQSSESDTRQTPPRAEDAAAAAVAAAGGLVPGTDMLQAAAASAGIVTVALTIPTSSGQVVVTSAPILQTQLPVAVAKPPYVPPPPPPPPSNKSVLTGIKVKQETANLFEELCQSVAGPTASPGNNFLSMVASPGSLGSTTSTLSPLSSIASPPQSLTPRPALQSPSLQLHVAKSDAPGKDKNRKKSKSKPACKTRTIKFHEYKGPPSAAQKLSAESTPAEETSYQLMLQQQNCLLKFLEKLNKNQSIIPAANGASVLGGVGANAKSAGNAGSAAATPNTNMSSLSNSGDMMSNTSSPASSTFSIISTPRPPPLPSPALSISSSIPPSPATSYAESTCSIADVARLEKMKVSDLKLQLKRRNLPVSGPKPQLIERLKPYLPLDAMDCSASVNTPAPNTTGELMTLSVGEAMDASNTVAPEAPVAMIVNSPRALAAMSPERANLEQEQMDVVQQVDSPHPVALQTVLQPQPQTATIILSNDELLREQQRKIDELQRQLQRSQQELQQIRQKQQFQQHHQHQHQHQQQQQTVSAQVVNALPTQQITLITTAAAPPQTLTMLPQIRETLMPAKATAKAQSAAKATANANNAPSALQKASSQSTPPQQPMTQKMVVKQQLEAKIQKQKQAAAAAAAAQAQAQAQAQALAQAQQAQALAQAQTHLRRLTQKTHTVLIPTTTTTAIATPKVTGKQATARQKNAAAAQAAAAAAAAATSMPPAAAPAHTTTILTANQIPLTKTHNNLGLVWNEGNQTIFLVGLNDQHMTAHTIGNISLANASPDTKKLLNGHQRTSSLPSIIFPVSATRAPQQEQQLIEAKPIITQQQLQHLQLQQQFQQQLLQQQQLPAQQQLIQLDIKPQNLPPPPPPPPQYEEATKQLAHKAAAAATLSHIKIKEEPNPTPAGCASVTTQTQNKQRKCFVKSEKLTDVLDILVKQGELPESALEPITPITPLTPGGSNSLMTDMSGNLIFTSSGVGDVVAATGELVPKQEPLSTLSADCAVSPAATVILPMDTTASGEQRQQQQQQRFTSDSVFQLLSANASPNAGAAGVATVNSFIENIDMTSPLQPDCHIDAESVAKTLDIFLDQHHSTPPPTVSATHHQSPTHHHDMLSKSPVAASPERATTFDHGAHPEAKLNSFDELELFEFMSQELEMDIGDDASNFGVNSNSSVSPLLLSHHSNDKSHNSPQNGLRRDMNPSLQPSINELIQQQINQQQQHHQQQGGNNNNSTGSGHQGSAGSPASSCGSLGNNNNHHSPAHDFDAASFVEQLSQAQHSHNQHHHNNNSNVGGNKVNCIDSGELSANVNHENHYSATPMDVCDDFDNPLGSFSFSALSPDSNINTPPHPFGYGGLNNSGLVNGNACGMQAVSGGGAQTQPPSAHEQMSICGASSSAHGIDGGSVDSFGGSADIFDLFNTDDYKMSWGEGDFAV